jgi:hypothetical protein
MKLVNLNPVRNPIFGKDCFLKNAQKSLVVLSVAIPTLS